MTNSPKPKPPAEHPKKPVTKLTMYVVVDPYGDDFEIRGRDESDVRRVYFETFGVYPTKIQKKPFSQPLYLTQRIQDGGLKALLKKLEKQGKN